jgi:hypothetical protein
MIQEMMPICSIGVRDYEIASPRSILILHGIECTVHEEVWLASSGDLHDFDAISILNRAGLQFAGKESGFIELDDHGFAAETQCIEEGRDGESGREGAFFAVEGDLHAGGHAGAGGGVVKAARRSCHFSFSA